MAGYKSGFAVVETDPFQTQRRCSFVASIEAAYSPVTGSFLPPSLSPLPDGWGDEQLVARMDKALHPKGKIRQRSCSLLSCHSHTTSPFLDLLEVRSHRRVCVSEASEF